MEKFIYCTHVIWDTGTDRDRQNVNESFVFASQNLMNYHIIFAHKYKSVS